MPGYTSLAGQQAESIIGKTVKTKDTGNSVFLVTGVSYDVMKSSYTAHLRRIGQKVADFAGTVELSKTYEVMSQIPKSPQDGFTLLVTRAVDLSQPTAGSVFLARTDFKEYQFRPLMKYLESPLRRLLIADEVGLGKTIEACYVLIEEMSRSQIRRVIILCPSALCNKWRDELWRRFGLRFKQVSASGLRHALQHATDFQLIVSMDSMRRRNDSRQLSIASPIDFLIIDEAHHMIGRESDTLRRTLGVKLSAAATRLIALSATPIQIELDDLRRVLEVVLGKPYPRAEFDRCIETFRDSNKVETPENSERTASSQERGPPANPLAMYVIRNTRKSVGEVRTRAISNCPIELNGHLEEVSQDGREITVSEHSLFQEVDTFLKTSFTLVHRRQLSSCLPAMIDLMRSGMQGFSVWQKGKNSLNQLELQDQEDQQNWEEIHKTLSQKERTKCAELADKFGLVSVDSKWNALLEILGRLSHTPASKALVFTQWIPTLRYLSRKANDEHGFRAFAVSGEDNSWTIERTLRDFAQYEGPAVLLTTDMLSEGIDLQVASVIINYDFPYNPQRVEQRIGRADRIGQKSETIEIYNLWIKGSIEEAIVELLDKRLNIFRLAIGDASSLFKVQSAEDGRVELLGYDGRSLREIALLNDSVVLHGVETFLDAETRQLLASTQSSFDRFVWSAIVRMMLTASGGRAKICEETEDDVKLGPIEYDDLQVISNWLGINYSGIVIQELLAGRDAKGVISVAKHFGGKGLYFPTTHPLSKTALMVARNSYEKIGESRNPISLTAKASYDHFDRILVCQYTLLAPDFRANKIRYWSRTNGLNYLPIPDRRVHTVQPLIEKAILSHDKNQESAAIDKHLIQQIARDIAAWALKQRPQMGVRNENPQIEQLIDFPIHDKNGPGFEMLLKDLGTLKVEVLAAVSLVP